MGHRRKTGGSPTLRNIENQGSARFTPLVGLYKGVVGHKLPGAPIAILDIPVESNPGQKQITERHHLLTPNTRDLAQAVLTSLPHLR